MKLLSFCLGDEGPGSILALLKEKGYATSLSAGSAYDLPEFGMLTVRVGLTPNGLEKWQDIVSIIYFYIYKMRQLNEKQWKDYFDEV